MDELRAHAFDRPAHRSAPADPAVSLPWHWRQRLPSPGSGASASPSPVPCPGPSAAPDAPAPGASRPAPGLGQPSAAAGSWPGALSRVNLVIPAAAWLGLSDAPGEIGGLGAADAGTCRDVAGALARQPAAHGA